MAAEDASTSETWNGTLPAGAGRHIIVPTPTGKEGSATPGLMDAMGAALRRNDDIIPERGRCHNQTKINITMNPTAISVEGLFESLYKTGQAKLSDHIIETLRYEGLDTAGREVFRREDGTLICDIAYNYSLGAGYDFCTKEDNRFNGNPDLPVTIKYYKIVRC